MLGLVRKKTLLLAEGYGAVLRGHVAARTQENVQLKQTVSNQEAAMSVLEHQRGVAMNVAASAEKERDKAMEDFKALESLHSKRLRLGTFTVNPLKLTAQLRAIEPSLRVEFDGDKVVVYSDKVLKPEVSRAVSGFLNGQWDRT